MTFQQKNYYTSAKTTKGLDGSYYASMFEANYANELYARKKNKEMDSYDTQVSFPLVVNGYKIASYIADFVVYHRNTKHRHYQITHNKGLFPVTGLSPNTPQTALSYILGSTK